MTDPCEPWCLHIVMPFRSVMVTLGWGEHLRAWGAAVEPQLAQALSAQQQQQQWPAYKRSLNGVLASRPQR